MRDWRGPVAVILAVGISAAIVAGVLAAELTPTKITTEEISLFSTLGGAVIGAIAAFLGSRPDRSNMTTQDPSIPAEPPEDEPTPAEPAEPEQGDTLEDGEGEDVGPDTE